MGGGSQQFGSSNIMDELRDERQRLSKERHLEKERLADERKRDAKELRDEKQRLAAELARERQKRAPKESQTTESKVTPTDSEANETKHAKAARSSEAKPKKPE